MAVTKNQEYTVTIEGYSGEGAGVARIDGFVVFVSGALRGEVCRVLILKVLQSAAFAKVLEVLAPSPHRIAPDCPYFPRCGGCTYRHMDYAEELALKRRREQDNLARIGGSEVEVEEILGAAEPRRNRNKAQYPVGLDRDGNVVTGFYSFHSHRIINCTDCILQPEIFARVIEITKDFIAKTNTEIYDETTGKGRLRHIYIRIGEVSGELMVCYVVNANGLKQEDLLVKMLKSELPQLKSVIINSNREKTNVVLGRKNRTIYGSDHITDTLCGLQFKISPFSFWQINRKQAEKLYGKAKEYANLKSDEILLDLYCGTGTIGLTMADSCKQLIGAEIVEDAVKDANENAKANGIENARFICGDASDAAFQLEKEGLKPDCVILDPPRKGCGEELVKTISRMSPSRVVYVSCDPATLARDLKFFTENGYTPKEITPCDMFSGTSHVESVALIERN